MTDPTDGDQMPWRWRRGQSGNPSGRPAGSRNRTLAALDRIGEDAAPEVLGKVVEAAQAGDLKAAEVLLSRLWPARKSRPVVLDLPAITTAGDVPKALNAILSAVASGDLTPEEGAAVAGLIEHQRKAIELADIEARIATLERNVEQ